MRRATLLFVACFLAPLAQARADSSGADVATAQALFDQGKKAVKEGNYASACLKFEESQRLDPGTGTLFNLADCYEHIGRLASAWGLYVEVADAGRAAGQQKREKTARERAQSLELRISHLVIHVVKAAPGLEVRRDGTPLGSGQWESAIPIDPGQYVITAGAPGRKPWETRVVVDGPASRVRIEIPELQLAPATLTAATEHVSRSVETAFGASRVDLTPQTPEAPPPPAPNTQRTVALVAAGVGGAGVVLGSYFGLHALSLRNEAAESCPAVECSNRDGLRIRDDAANAGNLSTVAFVVGGLGLATGVILWASASSPDEPRKSDVALGPQGVTLRTVW